MRVLITGSAGWIGRAAWAALEKRGHACYGMDLVDDGPGDPARRYVADLLDSVKVRWVLREVVPDVVVHLAAVRDPSAALEAPALAWKVNVLGTATLMEAMCEVVPHCRMAYASTVWVLGWSTGQMGEWERPTPPAHPYAASKLAGESVIRSYVESYGKRAAIMRFGIPYGEGQEDSSVVPAFVQKISQGEPVRMTGDGEQTRPFMWLGDLVDGIVKVVEYQGCPAGHSLVFHLCRSEEVSIRALADVVAAKLNRELKIETVPSRSVDMAGATPLNENTCKTLKWYPTTGIVEGVDRYVEWWWDTGVEGSRRGRRGLDR